MMLMILRRIGHLTVSRTHARSPMCMLVRRLMLSLLRPTPSRWTRSVWRSIQHKHRRRGSMSLRCRQPC